MGGTEGGNSFFMYRTAVLSEKVKVKLVNGFSVPLTLKGAGSNGEDVKVQLSVSRLGAWCGQEESSQVMFSLVSPVRLGLLDMESTRRTVLRCRWRSTVEAALIPAESMTGAAIWSWATGRRRDWIFPSGTQPG